MEVLEPTVTVTCPRAVVKVKVLLSILVRLPLAPWPCVELGVGTVGDKAGASEVAGGVVGAPAGGNVGGCVCVGEDVVEHAAITTANGTAKVRASP